MSSCPTCNRRMYMYGGMYHNGKDQVTHGRCYNRHCPEYLKDIKIKLREVDFIHNADNFVEEEDDECAIGGVI